ncbi:hypothetical protein IJ095_00360 [Candidatus Saccharibacteria bacterium]|nr:hypothetical protein [Candidatus Saccharibacteria bacterium]
MEDKPKKPAEKVISENETAREETFTEKTGAVLSKDIAVERAEEKSRRAPDPVQKYRIGLIVLGVFALAELLGMLYLILVNAEHAREISDLKTQNTVLNTRLQSLNQY